ncbi:MAG: hypothetical protein SFU27_02730 [Thermonemataceae bacterium]|nr:hypothetical protein [Thermonemataceae bacterium]
MKKILFYLMLSFATISFYACDKSQTTDKKDDSKSNQALNDELQKELGDLNQEHSQWSDELLEVTKYNDTLSAIYGKLKPTAELGYEELVEKIKNTLAKDGESIAAQSKLIEEHAKTLEKHQKSEIDNKAVENENREFYKKHKEVREKHDGVVEEFNNLIKKHEEFVTKAGGKLPPRKQASNNTEASPSKDSTQKDSTKK